MKNLAVFLLLVGFYPDTPRDRVFQAPEVSTYFLRSMVAADFQIQIWIQEGTEYTPVDRVDLADAEPRTLYVTAQVGDVVLDARGDSLEQATGRIVAAMIEYMGKFQDRLPVTR